MTIPVELLVFLLSGNAAILTIAAHILFKLYLEFVKQNKEHAVTRTQMELEIASLRRDMDRNEQELEALRAHTRLQPIHH